MTWYYRMEYAGTWSLLDHNKQHISSAMSGPDIIREAERISKERGLEVDLERLPDADEEYRP